MELEDLQVGDRIWMKYADWHEWRVIGRTNRGMPLVQWFSLIVEMEKNDPWAFKERPKPSLLKRWFSSPPEGE